MGFESILVKIVLLIGFITGMILIIPTKKDPDGGNPELKKIFSIVNSCKVTSRTEKAIVLEYKCGNDAMRDANLLFDAGFKGSMSGVELTVIY